MAYNIIFYFSDQQRWDTCGCFGQPLNITPNLDELAAEGVKFSTTMNEFVEKIHSLGKNVRLEDIRCRS